MNSKEWYNRILESFENDIDFRLEKLVLSITECISKRMEDKNINRKKLSELLAISPPAVTRILNGTSNFTLKTLLSLADALELKLKVEFEEMIHYDSLSTFTISAEYDLFKDHLISVDYQDYQDTKDSNKRLNFIISTADDDISSLNVRNTLLRDAA